MYEYMLGANYEYEMSEKLFVDLWGKYGSPKEIKNPDVIYNFLNDLILSSKHKIILDHYSHINFDEVIKVDYIKDKNIFKFYWLDNNEYRLAHLEQTISKFDMASWKLNGFCTYEYLAVDIKKIVFVNIKNHIFILIRANMVSEKKMKSKIVGKNEVICMQNCTDDLYARYVFFEGKKENLKKIECIANNLPYYVCVIQPKQNYYDTGFSKELLLHYTLTEINERLKKVEKALTDDTLDEDDIFEKGNTIRRVMEYALKLFCVISDIKIDIEKSYGHIKLSTLSKKIEVSDIQISKIIVRIANEFSHDSGKNYNIEDVRKLLKDVLELVNQLEKKIENNFM